MKVLFAVNNENISESIVKRYQQDYKEIISAKNVYYFNAIIKELQKDKTYDRIVISEDLEPFSNNNYDQIDKFIFDKMDTISDEATNTSGNDIPIILICADRRTKSEPILVKLFGIGVYNAIIGKDRSITTVCELLNRPHGKKEAKVYYRIDSEDVDYKVENESDVSEVEIQNILNHYKKLGRNEEKYVESFDHIASQYTDSQLRLIAKFLPLNVKAVLEANSPKYQEIVSFSEGVTSSRSKSQNYNNYQNDEKHNKVEKNNKKKDNDTNLELIERNLNQNKMKEPVIIPSSINTSKIRKMENKDSVNNIEESQETIQSKISQDIDDMFEDLELPSEQQAQTVVENIPQETLTAQPKRRGRPKKVQPAENIEPTLPMGDDAKKRGRGRPKKVQAEPVNLFELDKENEQLTNNQNTNTNTTYSDIFLPGLDDEDVYLQQETDNAAPILPQVDEEEPQLQIHKQEAQDTTKEHVNESSEDLLFDNQMQDVNDYENNENKEVSMVNDEGELNILNAIPNYGTATTQAVQNTGKYDLTNTDLSGLLTRDKKVVAFVGTSKNGTSFLVNNLAEMFSQKGIKTAVLDLTQNRNAYYIYTQNEEALRTTAYQAISNLKNGNPTGIQVNKNLTVYTTLPGENDDINDYANILETLIKNYSLILLDCDFETNYGYFKEAQEIYLVQSLDVLTIQPLTAFLRDLKAKNVLNPEKIRIALNKVVRVRSITERTIIGGMAFYNDPAMSFMTELFNKDLVPYCSIPFEEQAYSKYLEGLVNCKISLNGYSKNFMSAFSKLANMVYPLIGNGNTKTQNAYNNSNVNNNFSSSMNDTLNKMRNNY